MALCLPKSARNKLSEALKSREISIAKLYEMTDAERNIIFGRYVGKDFASFINAKFEQAMLSNQKKAFANWIERTISTKEPIRRDMLKKVARIEKFLAPDEQKGFLKDLAEMKLGLNITEEEAKTILTMKKSIDDLKVKIPENSPVRSQERLEYGFAVDDFKQYVGKLKLQAETLSFGERLLPKNWEENIKLLAGTTKSLVASLDNSFIGRQGIKTLLRGDYGIWARTFWESWKNMGKELFTKAPGWFKERDDAVMRAIRADIWSRPNALNGKYTAAKNGYGLGVIGEEAFPTSLPERIPLLGRIFKMAESAFNGSALRMRADLADAIITNAEKNGVDMLDEAQATAFGRLVGSLTGRGEVRKLPSKTSMDWPNVLMFSARFLKGNFDTITAHLFDRAMTPEAKKVAVNSTLRIAASLTALLSVAKMLGFDVEFEPRSSRFAQICYKNHCYDPTGGMRGLITLIMKIIPTYHQGEWGFWSKSPTTGKWTKMGGGEYGEQTALDTFEQFFEGKLSPGAGVIRDIWKGQKFGGEKPSFVNNLIGLIVPISGQQLIEELQKGNDDILIAMMAEVLGISPIETTFGGYGERWDKLRNKVDAREFNQALKQVTERFNERAEKLKNSQRWQNMNNDARSKELDRIKREETDRALNRYGL